MHDLVILAGGKGSRIKKYLNNGPKPLVKFNNIYFLDYLLFSLSKYNFENIYIMAGYKGHMIKKIYDKQFINLSKIRVIIEKKQLDTAGCLSLLKSKIKNDFFVTNGDTIFDVNLFDLKKI